MEEFAYHCYDSYLKSKKPNYNFGLFCQREKPHTSADGLHPS